MGDRILWVITGVWYLFCALVFTVLALLLLWKDRSDLFAVGGVTAMMFFALAAICLDRWRDSGKGP